MKGLVTRNTHVNYESPISCCSYVMTKVKVFVYRRRRHHRWQRRWRWRSRGYDNSSHDFRQGELKMYIQFKVLCFWKKILFLCQILLITDVINTYSRDMWPDLCRLLWWPVTLACCLGNLSVSATPRPLPACSIWSASGTTLPCVMQSGPCNIHVQVYTMHS